VHVLPYAPAQTRHVRGSNMTFIRARQGCIAGRAIIGSGARQLTKALGSACRT